jgi:HAD superfamily hydrolase (TIGR01509 family)
VIKGIFFDAADVFYERHESTSAFATRLLEQLGFSTRVSEQDLARQKDLHTQATEGRVTHKAYWDGFLKMRGVTDAAQRKMLGRQIAAQSNNVVVIPGGRAAMAGLKRRGFVLGIVTDTIYPLEWKMNWLATVGIAEFIDLVSCSSKLGTHKPNPEIYLDALHQARLAPNEAAFVGHDAGELEGARRVGMKTVAVNYPPGIQADYYAKSLVDLLNVPIFSGRRPEGGGQRTEKR